MNRDSHTSYNILSAMVFGSSLGDTCFQAHFHCQAHRVDRCSHTAQFYTARLSRGLYEGGTVTQLSCPIRGSIIYLTIQQGDNALFPSCLFQIGEVKNGELSSLQCILVHFRREVLTRYACLYGGPGWDILSGWSAVAACTNIVEHPINHNPSKEYTKDMLQGLKLASFLTWLGLK